MRDPPLLCAPCPTPRCAALRSPYTPRMIERIISGGQTGVDRAALDAALETGFPCAGWAPRGRLAEDGPIPERYPLKETPDDDVEQRTEWNVRDADGLLILTLGPTDIGTDHAARCAESAAKPILFIDMERMSASDAADEIIEWSNWRGLSAINIAGPRESSSPGVYDKALAVVRALLQRPELKNGSENA
ncbi:MAG: molybdenum cofactor carrier [Phycisphaeraceae bacterium]|nr:MAG: molybdenum cofactor carrier [Phycisphaeraceae bacterium]